MAYGRTPDRTTTALVSPYATPTPLRVVGGLRPFIGRRRASKDDGKGVRTRVVKSQYPNRPFRGSGLDSSPLSGHLCRMDALDRERA